jgi:acetyl esterase/lipase
LQKSVVAFVISVAFFAMNLVVACAASASETTVIYRPELGPSSPKLDIYSFPDAKNTPVLIYVHGGAWQWGSRRRVGEKPKHFNKAGYVFVSVDYRLVPKVRVEDQLDDLDHALGWIAENIGEYGGNPNNLHLMGHSAGAHLVAMTGVRPGKNAAWLAKSRALRTVISNDTLAYDVPRIAKMAGGKLHRIYQDAFGSDEKRWRRLSPHYQIDSMPVLPAYLLLYSGRRNSDARKLFAERFAKRLRLVDSRVSIFDGSKYSHRQMTVLIGVDDELTSAIDEFLGQQR